MENYNYNGLTEYEKAMRFLEIGCNCGCSKKISRERLRGEITASRRLKRKTRTNKRTFYY